MEKHWKEEEKIGNVMKIRKGSTKKPSKRYSLVENEEKVTERLGEDEEFAEILASLKPWVIKNLESHSFALVFNRVCPYGPLDNFLSDIEKTLNSSDFRVFCKILRKYYKSSPQNNCKVTHKINILKESLQEYRRLLSQKIAARENSEYLQIVIKELENQIFSIENPSLAKRTDKADHAALQEIFDFYSEKNKKNLEGKKKPALAFSDFFKFCKDFRLCKFIQVTRPLLVLLFKRNALYYKLMHFDQFLNSLFEISRVVYTGPARLNSLYKYLGLNGNNSYKAILHKASSLEHSSSEKIINKTLPFRPQKSSQLQDRLSVLSKPLLFPKTSCVRSRVPITWKILSETDINSLGKEFDVRDLIIESPEKHTKAQSIYHYE